MMLLLLTDNSFAQKGSKITTVVIDPGHGGRDPGALGKKSKEKDIVLDVALKTGEYIRKNLPDVKVVYTRSKDEFIELHRRAAIANKNEADVFISIHCNAAANTSVSGAETFVMGEHRTAANLEVAKLENAAILLEDNQDETYGGFDPNSTAAYIALSLYQSENKNQSLRLAQNVQEQFTKRVGRKDRSVQQAGFLVLYRTTMPSILIELGFITNPAEEEFMNSEQGKVYLASAIYRAFKEYKLQFETENAVPEKAVEAEHEAFKPTESTVTEESHSSDKPIYRVQFYTSPKEIPASDKRFKQVESISSYFHNGLYKYTSGGFASMEEASNHRQKLKSLGFNDAFVVVFLKSERISIEEAEKLK